MVAYEKQLRRLRKTLLPPQIPLLRNRKFGSLTLGQRYPRLGALTNDKDVCHPTINDVSRF